eukprot:COSAG01_NODE_357_length_18296_cov_18.974615_11_plen_69_part_00
MERYRLRELYSGRVLPVYYSCTQTPKDAWQRSEVAGSMLPGYNSVVMVAHTAPGGLLILESTDTGVQP